MQRKSSLHYYYTLLHFTNIYLKNLSKKTFKRLSILRLICISIHNSVLLHGDMKPQFTKKIIDWYQINQRELPWRDTKDPYKIWLSEIILQQTRVAQGLPYYFSFIERFPDIFQLAQADENEVLKLWQGLGYYSRARNLHYTAKYIVEQCNGIVPQSYQDLLKLKGIGDYTAAAIASFAYGEVVPVVDGNVFRVLSRYFGINTPIHAPKAKKEFKTLAFELIHPTQPDVFNQALMEFGAVQCVPKSPNCIICPLKDSCFALQNKAIQNLPVKTKKGVVRKRYFEYLIFQNTTNQTVIQKRIEKDIWQHLYEFPVIETEKQSDFEHIIQQIKHHPLVNGQTFVLKKVNASPIVHKLSHQELHINFWEIQVEKLPQSTITWHEVFLQPFPIIIYQFLKTYVKDL